MNFRNTRGPIVATGLIVVLALFATCVSNGLEISWFASQLNKLKGKPWFELFEHILWAVVGGIIFHRISAPREAKSHQDIVEEAYKHSNELVAQASRIGLVKEYPSRFEVGPDVESAIRAANREICLVGVGLSEIVKLRDLSGLLNSKALEGVNVRVILLNPISKEAVLRTLLESSQTVAEKIVGTPRRRVRDVLDGDPFFSQQLFCDSTDNVRTLANLEPLRGAVRFYSHSPRFWMVMADDEVFWQPYTNGSPEGMNPKSLGPLMPVFRFRNTPESQTWFTLKSDFEIDWSNCTSDLFHMIAMLEDKKVILHRIFSQDIGEFENMVGIKRVVRESSVKDRRKAVRRSCSIPGLKFRMDWQQTIDRRGNKGVQSILQDAEMLTATVEIVDFNAGFLALRTGTYGSECEHNSTSLPMRNQAVTLTVVEEPNSGAFRLFKRLILDPTDGEMKVAQIRKRDDKTVFVLSPAERKSIKRLLRAVSSFIAL